MQLLRLSYRVPLDAFYRFNADDGWAIASHIALSTLMSLFPFLILCTALAGFLGSKDLADEVANILLEAWPTQVATPIAAEIHNVLTTARGDLLTIGALLGMAAHVDGRGCSALDFTGLSQKNGAVMSHVRIAPKPEDISAVRITTGGADVILLPEVPWRIEPVVEAIRRRQARGRSFSIAVVAEGASDMPRRVNAVRLNERINIRRTPIASARPPTKNTHSVTIVEKVAAQKPACASLMPWFVDSHSGSVCMNENTPMYSRKVAR